MELTPEKFNDAVDAAKKSIHANKQRAESLSARLKQLVMDLVTEDAPQEGELQ
jgi:hypothetical protein